MWKIGKGAGGGTDNFVSECNPILLFPDVRDQACTEEIHKTQAWCVVGSPTTPNSSYPLNEKENKKKNVETETCIFVSTCTRARTVALLAFKTWVYPLSENRADAMQSRGNSGEQLWSAESLTVCLCDCVSECDKERWPLLMYSLMLMTMLLMCTVSYAGDVHNHMCWE